MLLVASVLAGMESRPESDQQQKSSTSLQGRQNMTSDRSAYVFLFLWLPLGLLGCSSADMSMDLVTLNQDYFGHKAKGLEDDSLGRLHNAYKQVKKIRSKGDGNAGLRSVNQDPLPKFLADDPVVSKVVIAAFESLSKEQKTTTTVTKEDAERFIVTVARNFGARGDDKQKAERGKEKEVFRIIERYLIWYYCDNVNGFVDREGTVYKTPEFKGSIDNDVIVAVVGIVLEGVFDGLLDVPVYVKVKGEEKKYETKNGKEPSVHRLKRAGEETIVADGQNGIDEYELMVIRYLSSLAADQSKLVSGAAYRMFGGLEIGFVVGGDFSFGDNETLAKVIDTTFEVSSKRVVEAAAYSGFKRRTDRGVISPDTPAARLIADIKRTKVE